MKRQTGGNRFIDGDASFSTLMNAISDGLGELEDWAKDTNQRVDWGAISIDTRRIASGKISVTVEGDMKEVTDGESTD